MAADPFVVAQAYRHALARITGLDESKIETTLVFTDVPTHAQVHE